MKTILILGATGMLGSTVGKWFLEQPDYDVWLTGRNLDLAYGRKDHWIAFDPTGKTPTAASDISEVFHKMPKNPDYVLNCLGVIKPFIENSRYDSVLINSLLPHAWATYCEQLGVKMIHITTDCVFSGARGNYTEKDVHDCTDFYGKSKSTGEPTHCMVIRTSIIGPEIHKGVSLVAWVQSQAGKKVRGFTDHTWNGITTRQYAMICQEIISKDLFQVGTFHVFSDPIIKCALVSYISDKYKLEVKVEPTDGGYCNRVLSTVKDLNNKLTIPPLQDQIRDM